MRPAPRLLAVEPLDRDDDFFAGFLQDGAPAIFAYAIPQLLKILLLLFAKRVPILVQPRSYQWLCRGPQVRKAIGLPNDIGLFYCFFPVTENPVFHHSAPGALVKFTVVFGLLFSKAGCIDDPFGECPQLRFGRRENGAVQKEEIVAGTTLKERGKILQRHSAVDDSLDASADLVNRSGCQPLKPNPLHAEDRPALR